MFARIVEINAKTGKGKELSRTLSIQAIDILREQSGFVDLVTLQSDDNQDRVIGISFWKSKEDATRYHTQAYQRIMDVVSSVTEGTPQVRNFEIISSTAHKVIARAA